jgi:hypothetical protein
MQPIEKLLREATEYIKGDSPGFDVPTDDWVAAAEKFLEEQSDGM